MHTEPNAHHEINEEVRGLRTMNRVKAIRKCLGVTQHQLGRALGMSQGNVGYLERGQTLMPDAAAKLIAYAARLGVTLSYDQIYGDAPIPAPRAVETE